MPKKVVEVLNTPVSEVLAGNIRFLRGRATQTAMQGVIVAVMAVILATLGVAWTASQEISLESIARAQMENPVLWLLDALPFVFAILGQYAGAVLAQEAGIMLMQQTDALRSRANQLEQQASFAATHDRVTDLPNRALFVDRLERALLGAGEEQRSLTVLLLAVDNLKEVQDTLGLNSADLLLKQLASRLDGWASSEDSVARFDGNSFGILIEGGSGNRGEAELAAASLIRAIEPPFLLGQMRLHLQVSIGIVLFPLHGDDADTLLQRAGVAQVAAGRSHTGFALYAPALDEHSPRRLTLMGELRRALDRNELQLHYQPKVELSSGRMTGVEALARWPHPQHGMVPPSEFIALAERTRLIRPLSLWVLERACLDAAEWHRQDRDWHVAINLSTRDLHDPELPDLIAGIVARNGVEPAWLQLEITESSIMLDPVRVLTVIERLHGMGYRFAIDDFGTGYSSLAYLKRLPVSELKIDRSFVMDMMAGGNDRTIVKATIDLAHNLGLSVTAEGVEDAATLEQLRLLGCDTAQGYHLARPMPISGLLALDGVFPVAAS